MIMQEAIDRHVIRAESHDTILRDLRRLAKEHPAEQLVLALVDHLDGVSPSPNAVYAIGLCATAIPSPSCRLTLHQCSPRITSALTRLSRATFSPMVWAVMSCANRLLTLRNIDDDLHVIISKVAIDQLSLARSSYPLRAQSMSYISQVTFHRPALLAVDFLGPRIFKACLATLGAGSEADATIVDDAALTIGKMSLMMLPSRSTHPGLHLMTPIVDDDNDFQDDDDLDDDDELPLQEHAHLYVSVDDDLLGPFSNFLEVLIARPEPEHALLPCLARLAYHSSHDHPFVRASIDRILRLIPTILASSSRAKQLRTAVSDWLLCLGGLVPMAASDHVLVILAALQDIFIDIQSRQQLTTSVRASILRAFARVLQRLGALDPADTYEHALHDLLASFVGRLQDPILLADTIYAARRYPDILSAHLDITIATLMSPLQQSGYCSHGVIEMICVAIGRISCFTSGEQSAHSLLACLEPVVVQCEQMQSERPRVGTLIAATRLALRVGPDVAIVARLLATLIDACHDHDDGDDRDNDDDSEEEEKEEEDDWQVPLMLTAHTLLVALVEGDLLGEEHIAQLAPLVERLLSELDSSVVFEDERVLKASAGNLVAAIVGRFPSLSSPWDWDRLRALAIAMPSDTSLTIAKQVHALARPT